jgi:biotin carboxyl carrier protein
METTVQNSNTRKRMNYKSLLIEDIKYRTLLTEKYKQRKPYQKKNEKELIAFIPGTVQSLSVKEKAKVKSGAKLLVLEAMKMKNVIVSPMDGTIKKIHVSPGDRVKKDQIILEFE